MKTKKEIFKNLIKEAIREMLPELTHQIVESIKVSPEKIQISESNNAEDISSIRNIVRQGMGLSNEVNPYKNIPVTKTSSLPNIQSKEELDESHMKLPDGTVMKRGGNILEWYANKPKKTTEFQHTETEMKKFLSKVLNK